MMSLAIDWQIISLRVLFVVIRTLYFLVFSVTHGYLSITLRQFSIVPDDYQSYLRLRLRYHRGWDSHCESRTSITHSTTTYITKPAFGATTYATQLINSGFLRK